MSLYWLDTNVSRWQGIVSQPPAVYAILFSCAVTAVAASHRFNVSGSRNCTTFIQGISASATNTLYNIPAPANEQQLAAGTIAQWASGSTYIKDKTVGTHEVNGTYDIFFEYCEPVHGSSKAAILQFTHGLVADHTYWDVTVGGDSSYSFVEAALKAGYATLTYDRLGVGRSVSGKPDGINVVQGAIETDIAIKIGASLKDGSLGVGLHSKVIGVGHSFGSVINVAVASFSPDLLDGIVLTGFTANSSISALYGVGFYGGIASDVNHERFGGLPTTYLIPPSQTTDQFGFFHYPNYTQSAIDLFTATKQTYTIGETLSSANVFYKPPVNYKRPLFVSTGERDAPFCDGNCYSAPPSVNGTNIASQLDTTRFLFPGASPFGADVVPDTGHAINFHTTAAASYRNVLAFLGANNL